VSLDIAASGLVLAGLIPSAGSIFPFLESSDDDDTHEELEELSGTQKYGFDRLRRTVATTPGLECQGLPPCPLGVTATENAKSKHSGKPDSVLARD
jgi:hypothetical protein